MSNITIDNVGKLLIEYIPEFKTEYKEFLKDMGGEKLIHILFDNYLFPFAQDSIKNKKADTLKKLGKFLSKCFQSGDDNIDNVIHVSFFENMKRSQFKELVPYLSVKLLAHLKYMDKRYHYFW